MKFDITVDDTKGVPYNKQGFLIIDDYITHIKIDYDDTICFDCLEELQIIWGKGDVKRDYLYMSHNVRLRGQIFNCSAEKCENK